MKNILYLSLFIICVICLSAMDRPSPSNPTEKKEEKKEKRIALLIGNGAYDKAYYSPLDNPVNDVNEMNKILTAKGFEVTVVKNADLEAMEGAIEQFITRLEKENAKGTHKVVSLFYFAGHGNYWQKTDESYLIPLGSKIYNEALFEKKAFSVNILLDMLQGIGNYLNIVMLDACRNNFVQKEKFDKKVSGGTYPGLTFGTKPHPSDVVNYNLFVSYATSKKGFAESGDGKYHISPYVASFKEVMEEKPDASIYQFFPLVHEKTVAYSKINRPTANIQFTKDFSFEQSVVPSPPRNGMIYVEGGTFDMGSDEGFNIEKPKHKVKVNSFYLDQYEVTFNQYDAYCEATEVSKPDDEDWGRKQHPVINVTWYDAIKYCNWRSKQESLTPCYSINGSNVSCNFNANGYRLPTEAEWEYAAGGGASNRNKWAGANNKNDLGKYANVKPYKMDDQYQYTAPVGSFLPNDLGLYDMSGNVWEWCWDWYDSDYYSSISNQTTNNPRGATNGTTRIVRGLSWSDDINLIRVTIRSYSIPGVRGYYIGFRCLRAY